MKTSSMVLLTTILINSCSKSSENLKNNVKLDPATEQSLQFDKDTISQKIIVSPEEYLQNQKLINENPVIILVVQDGNSSEHREWGISTHDEKDKHKVIAVPIVYYENGNYLNPPHYMEYYGFGNPDEFKKDNLIAKNKLLPFVLPGKKLYVLDNGLQKTSILSIKTAEVGMSDASIFSAVLANNPKVKLITNNSSIGKLTLKEVLTKPKIKKRKIPLEYGYYKDVLISKVDIDGDGFAEIIYESPDYEGTFYTIYSFKSEKWMKVYEGGYQGV